jgi:MYXO-CTERM domain-containing protein
MHKVKFLHVFAAMFVLSGCDHDTKGTQETDQHALLKSGSEGAIEGLSISRVGDVKPFESWDILDSKVSATNLALGYTAEVLADGGLHFTHVGGETIYSAPPSEVVGQQNKWVSGKVDGRKFTLSGSHWDSHFSNNTDGVSISWTLKSPSERGAIQFGLSNDHSYIIDGSDLIVMRGTERVFTWKGLGAWDATGQTLDVKYVRVGERVFIEYNDQNAKYPIYIDPVATSPSWSTYPDPDKGASFFGTMVRGLGDVNGDGFTDVLVGQPRYFNDGPNGEDNSREGRIILYYGTSTGLSQTAAWSYESDVAFGQLGYLIAVLGDVDGDGFADVAVSSLKAVQGNANAGTVYIFRGQVGVGLQSPTEIQSPSPATNELFGFRVRVGDYNCDGFRDIAVGSAFTNASSGRVWVYYGLNGTYLTPPQILNGPTGSNFGGALTSGPIRGTVVGVNACDDLLVGAPSFDQPGFNNQGAVYLHDGGLTGLSAAPTQSFFGSMASATLGVATVRLGDIDNDGNLDFGFGAPGQNSNQGAVLVVKGTGTGLELVPIVVDGLPGSRFGTEIAGGNINGDGFADLIVSARTFSNPETNEGAVIVHQYNGTSFDRVQILEGNQSNGGYGFSIHSGFDLNGDSIDDLLIGARDYPSPNDPTRGGAAFAHYGVADCFIDGAFVAAGDVSPTNVCEVCDPSVSQTAYSPLSCDDGDQCTTDSCDTTLGCINAVADNTPCDDGLFCTENEVCTAGACGGGTPLDCSGSPGECFEPGVCNEAADQCDLPTPSPAGDACGGAVCQTAGTCDGAGTCQGAAPVDCSNLDTACTVGQCNATTGACEAVNVTNGTSCDDGDACTNNDVCGGGVCGGSAVACDDGNPCTVESCDPVLGCVSVPAADGLACDDGNACTSADSCMAGVCGGSAVTCDDGNECTVDSCDAVLGCQAAPASAGTTCDDGLFCTVNNACDGAGACVGAPRDCSNAAATCFEGVACDEAADLCVPANPSASGTACGGDVCVDAGTCDGNGVCSGESNVDCSNLDTDCEIGVCDGTSGACVAQPRPDGTVCDDADACTENNICESGVCGGDAVVCEDDDNECTAPSCDPAQGCVFEDLPFGSTCSESFCSADGTSVSAGICDGSGACTEDTTTLTSCAPYVCGVSAEGAACLSSCEADVDCAEGFVCSNAECVEPGEDMGDMGTPDMGETDMGDDMGETDMGTPDMAIDDMGADMAGPDAGPQAQGQLEGSGLACASTDARPDHALLMLLVLGIGLRIRRR